RAAGQLRRSPVSPRRVHHHRTLAQVHPRRLRPAAGRSRLPPSADVDRCPWLVRHLPRGGRRMGRRPAPTAAGGGLAQRYRGMRAHCLAVAEGLSAEVCQLQSIPEPSPVKWHLSHTSWFFETFILLRLPTPAAAFNPAYAVLFNSYY